MNATLVGYARCSTDKQDLTAQRQALAELGIAPDRIYMDKGLTGTNRARPGLDQAMAAVRKGDTLVVPKLDRLARSVPDARHIADQLQAKGVKLALGRNIHDPSDPMGKMLFNILATFAEFEADLIRMRTREGMAIARAKGKLRGKPQALRKAATGTLPHARHRRLFHWRSGGSFRRIEADRLPDAQPRPCFHPCHVAPKESCHLALKGTFRWLVRPPEVVKLRCFVARRSKFPAKRPIS